jgi:hypothetical protein
LRIIRKRSGPTCQCPTPFNRPPGRWCHVRAIAAWPPATSRPRCRPTAGRVRHRGQPYLRAAQAGEISFDLVLHLARRRCPHRFSASASPPPSAPRRCAPPSAAPLRSVTPHPKPATALPADPSTGTIDLSSGRSPTAPLRPSCRERLHVHRCLRSPSDPASTSPSWALGLCCSPTRKPSSSTACAAQHRWLTPARACRRGG